MAVEQHSAPPAPQWMSGLGGCPGTPECSVLLVLACLGCLPAATPANPSLTLMSHAVGGLILPPLAWLLSQRGGCTLRLSSRYSDW